MARALELESQRWAQDVAPQRLDGHCHSELAIDIIQVAQPTPDTHRQGLCINQLCRVQSPHCPSQCTPTSEPASLVQHAPTSELPPWSSMPLPGPSLHPGEPLLSSPFTPTDHLPGPGQG